MWLVQCGEQVLQETTVCQQQLFRWTEVGPDNRQVSDSGHCISCEHFRRTDSLPKRDILHCRLSVGRVELDLLHVSVIALSSVIHI